MYRLYDFLPSGNGYKVRLLLTQLEIPFERVEMNIVKGATRTPEFLAINPNGRIPVLEIESGKYLVESNAILYYLSQNTDYFPRDVWQQAQVMQWLCFEQYSHEPNIATSRYWIKTLGKEKEYQAELQKKQQLGNAALGVMEKHLSEHDFFVGNQYSIADIGLYAYTHVADEGRFDLTPFPAVRQWINRVRNQPRHISITQA